MNQKIDFQEIQNENPQNENFNQQDSLFLKFFQRNSIFQKRQPDNSFFPHNFTLTPQLLQSLEPSFSTQNPQNQNLDSSNPNYQIFSNQLHPNQQPFQFPQRMEMINFDKEQPTTIEEARLMGQKGNYLTLWNHGISYNVLIQKNKIMIPHLSLIIIEEHMTIKTTKVMQVDFDFYNLCLNFTSFEIHSKCPNGKLKNEISQKVKVTVGGDFCFTTGKQILILKPKHIKSDYSISLKIHSPIKVQKLIKPSI